MKNIIAVIWDFDKTLINGYMQDPIFKDYMLEVGGRTYNPWQFITLLRNTRNGCYGRSIVEESQELLDIIYSSQQYEKMLVKKGGNKRGFITSENEVDAKCT